MSRWTKSIADRMKAIDKGIEELNKELKLLKDKKDSLLGNITLKTKLAATLLPSEAVRRPRLRWRRRSRRGG